MCTRQYSYISCAGLLSHKTLSIRLVAGTLHEVNISPKRSPSPYLCVLPVSTLVVLVMCFPRCWYEALCWLPTSRLVSVCFVHILVFQCTAW